MTRTPAAVPPFPERMEGEGSEIVTRLRDIIAEYERCDAKCPVRRGKGSWFGKKCPTCLNDDNGGCGLEVAGAFRVVREVSELTRLSITREPQEG